MRSQHRTMTVAEAAGLLGRDHSTVVRMAQAGRLPVVAKAPGLRGAYFLDAEAVEKLAADKVGAA